MAVLVVDGRRPGVQGEPGGWTYGGAGDDAPWLPASALEAIHAPAAGQLRVELPHGPPAGTWVARIAAAADASGADARPIGAGDGSLPGSAITLTVPPRGSWVLAVDVQFADHSGSAVYFWRVEVP